MDLLPFFHVSPENDGVGAGSAGLLEDELRRRRSGQELIATLDEIRRQPGAAPTDDEIQAEIAAVRKSRRDDEGSR